MFFREGLGIALIKEPWVHKRIISDGVVQQDHLVMTQILNFLADLSDEF